MINITRNKLLFARQTRVQQSRLELKFYKDINPVLRGIWQETAGLIVHGDVLNIVPVVVNRYTNRLTESFIKNYKQVGLFNFKQVTDRLQEIKPKRVVDYYFKDANYNFWYYYNLWCKQQAVSKVTKINNATKKALKNIIDKGIKESKSYVEIAKDIKNLEQISSKSRAMMIAETEIHTAFNKSQFESIESTNVKMETKEWLNAGDERVRIPKVTKTGFIVGFDHKIANNEKVGMEDTFKMTGEDLMFPGDPNGDPANIIRCRCVTLYNTEVTTID